MPASFLRFSDAIRALCAAERAHLMAFLGSRTYPVLVEPHHPDSPWRLTYTTDPQHVTTREDRP